MSDIRVTGGYEPNDPVVMSREEYRAALAQAQREGIEAMRDAALDAWPSRDAIEQSAARLLTKEEGRE